MFPDEKKKKESLSWIDEILSGGEDPPLAGILKKEDKKEQSGKNKVSEEHPVPPSGASSLEDILSGSATEKRDSTLAPPETGADLLSQLLGKEEKPQKLEKEKTTKKEKRLSPSQSTPEPAPPVPPSAGGATGADFLAELLGGSSGSTASQPIPTSPSKPVSNARSIFSESLKEESSYAGRAQVLDAYGNVRILKVKGEPVPIYELRLPPKLSKEEEQLFRRIKDRAITEIQIDPTAIPNPEERRKIFMNAVKKMIKEEAPPHYSEGRIEVLAT